MNDTSGDALNNGGNQNPGTAHSDSDGNSAEAKSARKRLLLIIACFAIPLLLAIIWLQVVRTQGGTWGNTSRGELLHPALPLTAFSLEHFTMKNDGDTAAEAYRESGDAFTADSFRGTWSMLYMPEGACTQVCETNIYHMRQVRLALNNRMNRVQRITLVDTPDQFQDEFLAEHLGLHVLSGDAQSVGDLRDQIRTAEENRNMEPSPDAIYMVDPYGNVMMRFAPDLEPGKMLKDIKHLLKVSRIG